MPYGFTQERLSKGIKDVTVEFQVITVQQFFVFLRLKHKRDIAPNEITSKDVREFLDDLKYKEGMKDSTIYRKQSNLKGFFDYLWRKNIISHDIMVKFNYFNESISKITEKDIRIINYDYEFLLEQKKRVLNSELPDTCKFLMLLYLRGMEVSDMYDLQVNHVKVEKDKSVIRYVSKTGYIVVLEFTDEQEMSVIESIVTRAEILRGTPYLISVKTKENVYEKSKPILTRYYMVEINKYIGINLRADDVRITYVNWLYNKNQNSLEEIAQLLGRTNKYVLTLLDTSLERMKIKGYNQINSITHAI